MPVTDFTSYLGMPQQAPASPVFNQTRRSTGVASLDREAADFQQRVAARDNLYRLSRQTPVLQAQQAQNAYDEVAQQANDLRMKQEIEAQVERAASELAGGNLNPESDDFAVKYRDLATRNPLAFGDARFKNVAGLYEGQHQNYQQARAAQAEAEARAAQARIDAENAAYAFGVPAGRITPEMSIRDINIERGKVKTAGAGTRGSTQDASLQMMQKDYELVGSRLKAMEDAGQSVLYDKDGAEIPNPKFDELAKEHDRLFNELRGSYQGKYRPVEAAEIATQQQVSPASAAASSALTSMASAATPFSPAALPAAAISSALPPSQVASSPQLPEIPLTAFEQQQKQKEEERQMEEAKKAQSSMETWSTAKNQAMMQAEPLQGLDPVRITNLARAAVVGGPIEGTEQEKQIINRIAGYARAAIEDKTFDVGVPVRGPSGKTETVKSKATPGWALLRDFNLDPREVIEIPGQGIFGTSKTMYAGDLMDLRLKEIGQPLVDTKAAQEQSAKAQKIKSEAQAFRGK
jgi:hypothetical protein